MTWTGLNFDVLLLVHITQTANQFSALIHGSMGCSLCQGSAWRDCTHHKIGDIGPLVTWNFDLHATSSGQGNNWPIGNQGRMRVTPAQKVLQRGAINAIHFVWDMSKFSKPHGITVSAGLTSNMKKGSLWAYLFYFMQRVVYLWKLRKYAAGGKKVANFSWNCSRAV